MLVFSDEDIVVGSDWVQTISKNYTEACRTMGCRPHYCYRLQMGFNNRFESSPEAGHQSPAPAAGFHSLLEE